MGCSRFSQNPMGHSGKNEEGGYILASVRLLNFSLGYTKLVTPSCKNQLTLRKLWYLAPKAGGEPSKIGHIFTK